jgi:hypothetical protein
VAVGAALQKQHGPWIKIPSHSDCKSLLTFRSATTVYASLNTNFDNTECGGEAIVPPERGGRIALLTGLYRRYSRKMLR